MVVFLQCYGPRKDVHVQSCHALKAVNFSPKKIRRRFPLRSRQTGSSPQHSESSAAMPSGYLIKMGDGLVSGMIHDWTDARSVLERHRLRRWVHCVPLKVSDHALHRD